MLTAYLFTFLVLLQGIISLRITTQQELYVTSGPNASIVLNCTYVIENSEAISYMYVYWKKSHGSNYAILAEYYPDNYASMNKEGDYLRNRSYLVNPGNRSTSAILTINDVRCEDDGHYQCYVWYLPKGGKTHEDTQDTVVIVSADAEQPIKFTIYPYNNLKENDTVTLSCFANAGNPDGFVAIWRVDKSSTASVLLNETAIVGSKTENCTTLVNATVTYIISRYDDSAFFRCSSQNRLTQGPAPSRNINPIEVLYGPSKPRILLAPNKTLYVGDEIQLTCVSDGNPFPNITWKFHPDNCVNSTETLQPSERTLKIQLRLEDSGTFCCFASNIANGKIYHSVSQINIKVWDTVIHKPTCDSSRCGITETCNETNGKVICTANDWAAVAFVFVLLATGFGATTVVLLCRLRQLTRKATTNEEYEVFSNVQSQEMDSENARYEALNTVAQTSA